AAGGKGYTKLTHDLQPQLDLSEQVNLGRAVLFGRVDKPISQLVLQTDREISFEYDQCQTLIRIILPIELPKKK
ncbi:MAG: hypothetical protein AAGA30_20885, partial [Planctomycetota bacterium]